MTLGNGSISKPFSITRNGNSVTVVFSRATDFNAIRQLEFSSRLIYGFAPDENNIWRPGVRSKMHIYGFPPEVKWDFTIGNKMVGKIENPKISVDAYIKDLQKSINGLCPVVTTQSGALYEFAIIEGQKSHEYSFNKRARAICALAVLSDLQWHPRKDLEIWINLDYTDKRDLTKPIDHKRVPEQYYGDPSKIADELRNEGWPRDAAEPLMFVEYRPVLGQTQQHYRITQLEQVSDHQKKRSNIKPAWRRDLFEKDQNICQICLTDYSSSPENLAPDHRIPVIFEADNLNDSNFLEKLMTLCRFCNQAKREFTKRLDHKYDWTTSPWAYPEKFRISIVENQIRAIAKSNDSAYELTLVEVFNSLKNTK